MKLKVKFKGLQFVNAVKGGNVPRIYSICRKGFREAMKTGPLAGYQVDSLKVTLDGSFHLSILMRSLLS
jgi:elongation factor G